MATLREKESGKHLGQVSDEDLQFLIDQLEEESNSDTDYYIDAATIDMLEENGASSTLISLLRASVTGSDGIDIECSRS